MEFRYKLKIASQTCNAKLFQVMRVIFNLPFVPDNTLLTGREKGRTVCQHLLFCT